MNNIGKNAISLIIVVLFAGLGAFTFSIPEVKKSVAMATTVTPERYTELYFEDHLNLTKPTGINEPQTFSFTVHNLEHQTMKYPYEIFVQDTTGSRSGIVNNTVTLRHNEQLKITESFEILEPLKRAKVVVRLLNKNQEIHYWIGEELGK